MTRTFLDLAAERPRAAEYDTAAFAILPVPFERTVSYGGGTAAGPQAIIDASAYVEFYDDEFDRELCFETGIATLNGIELDGLEGQEAIDAIRARVGEVIDDGKTVVTLGGEHAISTGPILAHLQRYPDMGLLHLDAHSDLRESYEGSIWSHASFAARVAEHLDPSRITQVGIRAQCAEEAEFIRSRGVNTFYASAIRRGLHGEEWQKEVVQTLPEEVYLTFDVDYFDPAIMPATGTPEPDGFLYSETIDLFREIRRAGKRLIGFDLVELAPMEGLSHPDLTSARLLYKLMHFCAPALQDQGVRKP